MLYFINASFLSYWKERRKEESKNSHCLYNLNCSKSIGRTWKLSLTSLSILFLQKKTKKQYKLTTKNDNKSNKINKSIKCLNFHSDWKEECCKNMLFFSFCFMLRKSQHRIAKCWHSRIWMKHKFTHVGEQNLDIQMTMLTMPGDHMSLIPIQNCPQNWAITHWNIPRFCRNCPPILTSMALVGCFRVPIMEVVEGSWCLFNSFWVLH